MVLFCRAKGEVPGGAELQAGARSGESLISRERLVLITCEVRASNLLRCW